MMGAYARNREWSDRMLPQVRHLIGPLLLEPAPLELDCKQATDLIVLKARDMRIAVRVRRPGYYCNFKYEFTLRAKHDNGAETELSKIVNGWGDWLFYGHADKDDFITLWWLVDLYAFRAALIRNSMNGGSLLYEAHSNRDGTHFVAFDLRSFPEHPPILVSSSEPLARDDVVTRTSGDDHVITYMSA